MKEKYSTFNNIMGKCIDVLHRTLLGKIIATLDSYHQILGEYNLE